MSITQDIINSRGISPKGTFHAVFAPRRAGKTSQIIESCQEIKKVDPSSRIVIVTLYSIVAMIEDRVRNTLMLDGVVVTSSTVFFERFGEEQFDYAFFDEFSLQTWPEIHRTSSAAHEFIAGTTVWGFTTAFEGNTILYGLLKETIGVLFGHIAIYAVRVEKDRSCTIIRDASVPTDVDEISGEPMEYIAKEQSKSSGCSRAYYQ